MVIDCGTGYTKMGYAGNCEPSFIIPSVIGTKEKKSVWHSLHPQQPPWELARLRFAVMPVPQAVPSPRFGQCSKEWKGVEDLDFHIGDEAVQRSNEYSVSRLYCQLSFCLSTPLISHPLLLSSSFPASRQLPNPAWRRRELGQYGILLAALHLQVHAH